MIDYSEERDRFLERDERTGLMLDMTIVEAARKRRNGEWTGRARRKFNSIFPKPNAGMSRLPAPCDGCGSQEQGGTK